LLRRVLLGLVTALIAARALLPGEDVGLLEPGSNPMGLVMPVLWLAGLAAWAAWRSWSRQLDWYGGLVEAGLFLVVLFSFVSTVAVAPYQHPAWIVSWEWAGLVAAFFLVRQIARSAVEQRALLAALLASGVSLAAQSLYQRALPDPGRAPVPGLTAAELPRRRCEVLATFGTAPQNAFPGTLALPALAAATSDHDPTLFERIAARNNVRPEAGEPVLPRDLRPVPPRPPTATFTSEANLAGYLALLMPALAGCVLASWIGGMPRWQVSLVFVCALVTALALALTRVRSAIMPCLLVSAVAWFLIWSHYRVRGKGMPGLSERIQLALGLAGPAVLLLLAFLVGSRGGSGFDGLTREWSSAWKMIRDHFWLGVGPGNYGRTYTKYMAPTAPAFATQPDSFFLEVWATLGLPALLGLGLALVCFFRRALPLTVEDDLKGEEEGTRWEFYEGAMVGLVVGFLLRALPAGQEAIIPETVDAIVRAVVWFAAFALLQNVRWSGPTRGPTCFAGVAVLLLHLAVSGGFFVPGLTQPLLILAALALNGLPERPITVGRQFVGRVLPLALATAAALFCAMQTFFPMTSAKADNIGALAKGQKFLDVRSHVTRFLGEGKTEVLKESKGELLKNIVGQLSQAIEDDPKNARYWVDYANWYGTVYEETNPPSDEYLQRGLKYALTAQKLDPLGEAGYLAESRLYQLGARRSPKIEVRMDSVAKAAGPLFKLLETRKNDAQLHYRLAVVLIGGGDLTTGKEHAADALQLDKALGQVAPDSVRRLSQPQREQAERFVARP
jgi:O-antigen ligase